MEQDTNNIPELQSPFEQLREVDADGKEWWNSRKLARVMGYGKYWNFERVTLMVKASGKYSHLVQEKQVDNAPIIQVAKRKQRQVAKSEEAKWKNKWQTFLKKRL